MSKCPIAVALGKMARGHKKTMSAVAIAHRQRISSLGVAARAKKRKLKTSNSQN